MTERNRLAEIKVGVFVLVALTILVLGTLWIAGSTFWGGQPVSYRVLMTDSGGIRAGDRVRVAGVEVGRIEDVELRSEAEWPVVFRVNLDRGVLIKKDASALIATTGILGANVLKIETGSPGAPPLRPGGEIRGRPSLGLEGTLERVDEISGKVLALMGQTAGILDQVSGEMGPILQRVEQLLSQENTDNMGAILSNLNETLVESRPHVEELLARLDSIARRVDQGVVNLPEFMDQITTLTEKIAVAIGPDGARLAALLDASESSLTSAGEVLDAIGTRRGQLEATLMDLRDTIANLKAFSQQIKERPFSLVRIKPAPERRPGQGVGKASP